MLTPPAEFCVISEHGREISCAWCFCLPHVCGGQSEVEILRLEDMVITDTRNREICLCDISPVIPSLLRVNVLVTIGEHQRRFVSTLSGCDYDELELLHRHQPDFKNDNSKYEVKDHNSSTKCTLQCHRLQLKMQLLDNSIAKSQNPASFGPDLWFRFHIGEPHGYLA